MREGWHETTLGEVASLNPKVEGVGPESPFITMSDVTEWGRVAIPSGPRGTRGGIRARGGDVLVARITPCLENGKIALVDPSLGPVGGSTEFIVLRGTSHVTGDYLLLWAQSREVHSAAVSMMIGSTGRQRVSAGDLSKLPIALPPLHEQRRVVDLIAAVDDAIDAAEAEDKAADSLVESRRDAVIWRANVDRAALSAIASVVGGLVSPIGVMSALPHIGTDRIEAGTGRLIGVRSAAEDQVTSGKYLHEAGTVIYSKIRPNLRKVAIPDWRGLCSADAYPMLPTGEGDVSFLRHLLLSRPFTAEAVARSGRTKMPKINRAELLSIEVPVIGPAEQTAIASELDAIRAVSDAARDTAESLRALRSNLLTVLLSGEHEIPASYDALLGEVA